LSLASHVAARFDKIADVYDETRESLSNGAIERAAAVLRKDGVAHILEAGVGTGRIAGPLRSRGFELVGLDLSARMISRAKTKGVSALVRADANSPPFRRGAFDAVLMAHVLHLLDSPAQTFGRLARLAKKDLVVFLRKPESSSRYGQRGRREVYQAFMQAASELRVPLSRPYATWRERYARQSEFLAKFPPTEFVTIQELRGSATLRYYMSGIEKRAFSFASELSDEDFRRVAERAKQRIDLDSVVPHRRVDQMAIWRLGRGAAHFR
jgi:ubiquinone/menaquinone biosynthesis C-methylase UbiE